MSQPGKNVDPPSTGFVLVERILHEYRDGGRSASLDSYKSQAQKGLQQYRAANTSPRAAKDAQTVETAVELAVELIETLRQDARRKST